MVNCAIAIIEAHVFDLPNTPFLKNMCVAWVDIVLCSCDASDMRGNPLYALDPIAFGIGTQVPS